VLIEQFFYTLGVSLIEKTGKAL